MKTITNFLKSHFSKVLKDEVYRVTDSIDEYSNLTNINKGILTSYLKVEINHIPSDDILGAIINHSQNFKTVEELKSAITTKITEGFNPFEYMHLIDSIRYERTLKELGEAIDISPAHLGRALKGLVTVYPGDEVIKTIIKESKNEITFDEVKSGLFSNVLDEDASSKLLWS